MTGQGGPEQAAENARWPATPQCGDDCRSWLRIGQCDCGAESRVCGEKHPGEEHETCTTREPHVGGRHGGRWSSWPSNPSDAACSYWPSACQHTPAHDNGRLTPEPRYSPGLPATAPRGRVVSGDREAVGHDSVAHMAAGSFGFVLGCPHCMGQGVRLVAPPTADAGGASLTDLADDFGWQNLRKSAVMAPSTTVVNALCDYAEWFAARVGTAQDAIAAAYMKGRLAGPPDPDKAAVTDDLGELTRRRDELAAHASLTTAQRDTLWRGAGIKLAASNRAVRVIEERVAAMLAAAQDEGAGDWPCANYQRPTTCLTAPSTITGRCDFCREQAAEGAGEVDRLRSAVEAQLTVWEGSVARYRERHVRDPRISLGTVTQTLRAVVDRAKGGVE